MFDKLRRKNQYLYKKTYLDRRLQHDLMKNGIAYIPCRVNGMEDIISKFSIRGVESLDSEFLAYILEYAEFIPEENPMVLEIYGHKFSEEEKKTITEAIASDLDYMLGKSKEMNNRRKRRFIGMVTGTVVMGAGIGLADHYLATFPREFIYVVFWLFADSLVRYLFIDKLDFRHERIRMGRLASMKIQFPEKEA